jgi:hypothetical protein
MGRDAGSATRGTQFGLDSASILACQTVTVRQDDYLHLTAESKMQNLTRTAVIRPGERDETAMAQGGGEAL